MAHQADIDLLPRRALMITCAAGFISISFGLIFGALGSGLTTFEQFTLPITGLASAIAFVILWREGQRYLVEIGRVMLSIWGLHLVSNIANQILISPEGVVATFVFSIWLPFYYVLAFVVMDKRSAQFISWWIVGIVTLLYVSIYTSLPAASFFEDYAVAGSIILLVMQPCVIVMLSAMLSYRVKLEMADLDVDSAKAANKALRQTLEAAETAQQEILAARELLSNTINSVSSGVVVFDKTGKLLLANKALEYSTEGLGIPMVPGISWTDLANKVAESGARNANYDETGESWLEVVERLHRNGGGASQFNLPDGRSFLVYERFWKDGTSVTTLTDVTELERNKETISQLHKMEALGRLTGGIAHDFNNLLSIILGNLEFVQSQIGHNQELNTLLTQAMDQTTKGATLVQQLLAFARGNKLKLSHIDPVKLIEEMLPITQSAVGEQIKVTLLLTGTTGHIQVESDLLQSMVINIALNARDAMPNGGSLTMEIALSELTQQNDAEESSIPCIALSFTDTGEGIPAENIQRVLEPFYTTKAVGEGSGLGLSMVYGLVKQFNGDLRISSKIGVGTTVCLLFPIVESEAASVKDSVQRLEKQQFHGKVLLVEDNPELREVSKLRLQKIGFDVVEVENIVEAKSKFKVNHFALVYSDVVLPDGNGYDLANYVRQLDSNAVILLTSGYTELNAQTESTTSKDFPFIQKPHSIAELGKTISQLLQ